MEFGNLIIIRTRGRSLLEAVEVGTNYLFMNRILVSFDELAEHLSIQENMLWFTCS